MFPDLKGSIPIPKDLLGIQFPMDFEWDFSQCLVGGTFPIEFYVGLFPVFG